MHIDVYKHLGTGKYCWNIRTNRRMNTRDIRSEYLYNTSREAEYAAMNVCDVLERELTTDEEN